jgi:hypothetical protein
MLCWSVATCSTSEPCAPIETRLLVSSSALPHPSAAPTDTTAPPVATSRHEPSNAALAPRSPPLVKLAGFTSIAPAKLYVQKQIGVDLTKVAGGLFLLPLANWQLNLRGRGPMAAGA